MFFFFFFTLFINSCERTREAVIPELNGKWRYDVLGHYTNQYCDCFEYENYNYYIYLDDQINAENLDFQGYLILSDTIYEIDLQWIVEIFENDSIKKLGYERREKGTIKKTTETNVGCESYDRMSEWYTGYDDICYGGINGTIEFHPDSGNYNWSMDFNISQGYGCEKEQLVTYFPCIINYKYEWGVIKSIQPIDTVLTLWWDRE